METLGIIAYMVVGIIINLLYFKKDDLEEFFDLARENKEAFPVVLLATPVIAGFYILIWPLVLIGLIVQIREEKKERAELTEIEKKNRSNLEEAKRQLMEDESLVYFKDSYYVGIFAIPKEIQEQYSIPDEMSYSTPFDYIPVEERPMRGLIRMWDKGDQKFC